MSPFVSRALFCAVATPALVLAVAAPASSSTGWDDPEELLFGEGCRYVAVDTPTEADPEVEVCRPW